MSSIIPVNKDMKLYSQPKLKVEFFSEEDLFKMFDWEYNFISLFTGIIEFIITCQYLIVYKYYYHFHHNIKILREKGYINTLEFT